MGTTRDPETTAATASPRAGRFGPIMLIGQLGWATLGSVAAPLLAALVALVTPNDKVTFLAVVTTVGAIGAVIANILFGYLSDRTSSVWGPRNPWIIAGAVTACAGFIVLGVSASTWLIVVAYLIYQIGINMMLGAFNALPADYVDDDALGRVSAWGGMGYLLAQIIGSLIGGALVLQPRNGFLIISGVVVIAAIIVVALLPKHPWTQNQKAQRATPPSLIPPKDKEFWWVFVGRFLFIISLFMTMQFQLYIATDRMGMTTEDAGKIVGLNGAIFALVAAVANLVTGPWSDKIKRRKPFVMIAPLIGALGTIPLLLVPKPAALIVWAVAAGIAFGSYISVDGALMIEVLPNRDDSARDLGFLSAANSLPMVLAPGIAAGIVKAAGYDMVFVIGIVLGVLAAGCISLIKRVR